STAFAAWVIDPVAAIWRNNSTRFWPKNRCSDLSSQIDPVSLVCFTFAVIAAVLDPKRYKTKYIKIHHFTQNPMAGDQAKLQRPSGGRRRLAADPEFNQPR
ncbi:MAG: hypothetical protein RKP73_05810, partial [Candidatus Contendobacter sp.]|nr:hypothetical protein [Candidatus Contendobacter sp.]